MEKSSSGFYKGLIRGLFDTDGSVQGRQSKGVSIRLAQSNLDTLRAIQRMLLRLGIFSKIYANRRPEGFTLMPDGRGGSRDYHHKPQHELTISNENIRVYVEKVGFGDSDKLQKVLAAEKAYRRRLNRERFLVKVAQVEPDGEEEVYDATVPGINAFDANGFHVHNCGEQPLLPYESCNLGSINLSKMLKADASIDWEKLRATIRTAIRFLDNVIDVNPYPLKETDAITRANRKIGLGVMGFADLLILMGVPYDSERAVEIGEEIAKFMEEESAKASEELGLKRGSFPNFEGSIWKGKYRARRNATVTTVAPTGTISIIAGCSSGVEPLFAVAFMRHVLEGARLFELHPIFEKMAKERGFYGGETLEKIVSHGTIRDVEGVPEDIRRLFVTAHDIKPEWHVRIQAAWQKYTENAVSKTVNLPEDASIGDVEGVYRLAHELHCKGVTIYRYGSKGAQVLNLGVEARGEEKVATAEAEYAGGRPVEGCEVCG